MYIEEDKYKRHENRMTITELFLKTLPRCSAPATPISFSKRFTVVSVYVKGRR
jgi:hypothetical protein